MLNKTIFYSIITSFLLSTASATYAGLRHGDLDGVYIPSAGWGKAMEVQPGESTGLQLGNYRIVLKRQGWNALSNSERKRVRRTLVIRGVFQGESENIMTTTVLNHRFVNRRRDGVLHTVNDSLFVTGVEPCSETGVILGIVETLNIDYGTGVYSELQEGGSITIVGTVNQCTLQNDFKIDEGEGSICFGDSC